MGELIHPTGNGEQQHFRSVFDCSGQLPCLMGWTMCEVCSHPTWMAPTCMDGLPPTSHAPNSFPHAVPAQGKVPPENPNCDLRCGRGRKRSPEELFDGLLAVWGPEGQGRPTKGILTFALIPQAYLRDDIACGVADGACGRESCPSCSHVTSEAGSAAGGASLDPRAPAYLVPDAQTLDALLEVCAWGMHGVFRATLPQLTEG